jgi:hypothetical protein
MHNVKCIRTPRQSIVLRDGGTAWDRLQNTLLLQSLSNCLQTTSADKLDSGFITDLNLPLESETAFEQLLNDKPKKKAFVSYKTFFILNDKEIIAILAYFVF